METQKPKKGFKSRIQVTLTDEEMNMLDDMATKKTQPYTKICADAIRFLYTTQNMDVFEED